MTTPFPTVAAFRIHDIAAFPLVRVRDAAVRPGYGFAWCAEMQRLFERAEPFVLVSQPLNGGVSGATAESLDDRRLRSIWLRANRAGVEQYCRGLLLIQAEVHRRVQTRRAEMSLVAGSGMRVMVISSIETAVSLAPVLLNSAGQATATSRIRSRRASLPHDRYGFPGSAGTR